MSHKYKLTYKLKKHPKGIAKDKIPVGYGGCDAVLFCSMIYPEDGSFSVYFIGVDGRTKGEIEENLEDIEWFKVWSLLASRLGASKTLDASRKDYCQRTFEGLRQAILGTSLN